MEDQNGLEATSHQKLATDGASPELTPTHTECLYTSYHELNQLAHELVTTHHHAVTGGGCFLVFAQNSNRTRLEPYAKLLVNVNQLLIQPLYGFLGPNLGWKRDWNNFIPKHANSDIAILGEFRPKSTGKRFKLLNQPHLTSFLTSL